MGCGGSGGGGGSSTKDSDRVLQYNFDNIVSEFLGAGINYKLTMDTPEYAEDTEKAYDEDRGRVESFSITPTMLASNTCAQQPGPLDLEKWSRFNISPVGSDRRVVNFKDFPRHYQPNFTDKCYYKDYNVSGRYIIGSSNEKLTDLSDKEEIVNPTDLVSLADMRRLMTFGKKVNLDEPLSEYMSSRVNNSDHEFIVNKDSGAVRVFDTDLNQYVNLDGTKDIVWQFYSENYLISSSTGGNVYIYDIKDKSLIKDVTFKVVDNFKPKIRDLEANTIIINYGLIKEFPFKTVYIKAVGLVITYVLDQGEWREIEDSDKDYTTLENMNNVFEKLKEDTGKPDFDFDIISEKFYATYNMPDGGFTVKIARFADLLKANSVATTKHLTTISDFPGKKSGIQIINGNAVIASTEWINDKSTQAFYMIKNKNRYRLGLNSTENVDNMKSIKASSHN